jgi:hypothetical protein
LRKRWLSLLLALVMLASVTVTTASADTVNLLDKTVTLSVTPSQSAICVGSTGDVYVTYTISIASDDGKTPIPAFSFVVPTDGKLATTATDLVWRFQLNTKLKQSQGGPYNTADYNPAKGYVGVGGSDNNGITEKTTVMTIVAKFPAESATGTYTPAFEEKDFIAGGGETIDGTGGVKVSNAFGTRNVQVGSVTVNPGATVSGTVKDSSGKAVSGAAVELYKDGTKVADATAGTDGKYTISNVSTGTYTLKAKGSDGSLNGSAEITVKADSIPDAHVTVAKGFTVSGTAVSWNATNDALYYLYPSTMEDADIKAEWKSGSYTGTACTSKGTPTASGKQFEQTFTFDTVAAGNYKLVIFKPGKYVPKIVSITVESTALDLGRLKLWLKGDVNGDGIVNGNDIQRLYSHITGASTLTDDDALIVANANEDTAINGNDIQRIFAHIVGSNIFSD